MKKVDLLTEIEEYLSDYFAEDELDCYDNINYLEDAITLLEKTCKIIKRDLK